MYAHYQANNAISQPVALCICKCTSSIVRGRLARETWFPSMTFVAAHHDVWVVALCTFDSPSDTYQLTKFQVFLRLHIEAFAASPLDVHLNQVGIRCRHCAHVPINERVRGAVYFPSTTSMILPSDAKHVFDAFAMWMMPGNARINQDTVWSIARHQDAELELVWWKNLLGALRVANGLG
jgi:hypothetical protein